MKQMLTAKLKLHPMGSQCVKLRRTQLAYRDALNYVSRYSFKHGKKSNQQWLQRETYDEIRLRFHLPSQMACNVPRQVGATYKGLWTKVKQNAEARKAGRTKKRYKGLDEAPKYVSPTLTYNYKYAVYRNFETIKKTFIVMSLAFVAYILTAIFSISSAVALLGATISPYNMFWQVQGEKEEQRVGSTKQKMRDSALDITVGVISGNLIAYFIIISTASTLFVHHQNIATAVDAARSLEPLLGPIAKYLFAFGLIGAGLVAIPVLLAITSYAVAGTFGWPSGLSKKPWQNEGFYLILTGALVVSIVVALIHLDPIKLIFWANVLSGLLETIVRSCESID